MYFTLIIILFILLAIIFIHTRITESFEDSQYSKFLQFYTPFCENWQKSISTSVMVNTPQKPLTGSPLDYDAQQQQQAQAQPTDQLNQFIQQLAQQDGVEYPPICESLPPQITEKTAKEILKKIPSDATPFINALNYMNKHLEEAQKNLDSKLSVPIEGFDSCQQFSQCLKENPKLFQELQEDAAQQTFAEEQQEIQQKLTAFFSKESQLKVAMQENKRLFAKANKIKDMAQSGELYKRADKKDTFQYRPTILPPGASTLKDMKDSDPAKYTELQKQGKSWFAVKQLIEQINSNL
jgi:hypothetical protein